MSSILISSSRRILPVVCLLLAASCAPKIEKMPVREKPVRPETPEAFQSAIRQTRSKVSNIGRHDWAGEYSSGGGLSWRQLILTPDGDVIYGSSCDIGPLAWDVGHVVEVRSDRILIEWSDSPVRRDREAADELLRVRWSGRHYLIPEHRMIEFCNDVNSGCDMDNSDRGALFGSWMFLLRHADKAAPLQGMPDVPPAYRKYLLKRPISVEITSVVAEASEPDGWDNRIVDFGERESYIVEVNAGANVGLLPQMTLTTESGQSNCRVFAAIVIAVERNTSRVRVYQNREQNDCAPCVGDRLTTRNGRTCSLERDQTSVTTD